MSISDFLPWRRGMAAGDDGAPLQRLQREVNDLFESLVRNPIGAAMGGSPRFTPAVDIVETTNAIEVTAELPGVPEDAVELQLTDEALTIRGEKANMPTDELENGLKRLERTFGAFERVITLPTEVVSEKVTASFSHGLLRISLPKANAGKPAARTIQISTTPPPSA